MVNVINGKANFTRDNHRFIVTENGVRVHRRLDSHIEYSLNATSRWSKSDYDARRYQLNKHAELISAVQTVIRG